jgi:cytoskeletal protein CcmA (bactofilin family)
MIDSTADDARNRWRSDAATEPGAVEPLVPSGGRFDGLVEVCGPARIDGIVDGEVIVADSLWIGAEAKVRARVEARNVVIEGEVRGEIRASEKIDLRATARVHASLYTGCFVLAEGAHFEGRCHTIASEMPKEAPAPPGTEIEAQNALKLRPSM